MANLRAHPDQVTVQDGPELCDGVAREVTGEEKRQWWERAVAVYPLYTDYQQKTDRDIPVFVVERADPTDPAWAGPLRAARRPPPGSRRRPRRGTW